MAETKSLSEETAKKVIRQVEFYFSDSNLPRDGFLKKTITESDDGMVSLALISSFTRMRGHLGLGDVKAEDVPEETVKAVAEILRTSTFLKVSEDGKKVGRVTELAEPEEVIKQLDVKTIAASPLEYNVKLEDVESFFAKYAKVASVRLPRHVSDNRVLCGTALIEFFGEEDAANILNQKLTYAGVELELKPKKDFDSERAKQEEEVAVTRPQAGSNPKDRSKDKSAEPDYPKGLIVAFKLKSISGEESNKEIGNHETGSEYADDSKKDGEKDKTEISVDVNVKGDDVEKVADAEEMETDKTVAEELEDAEKSSDASDEKEDRGAGEGKPEDAEKSSDTSDEKEDNGAGEGKPEDAEKSSDASDEKEDKGAGEGKPTAASYKDNKNVVLREDLKAIFQKFGIVKFIDFSIGSESGYVRFEDAEAAQKARAAAVLAEEGGLIVKNFIATLDPVTGEAEKEYWSLLQNNQKKHRDNFKSNRGRGGGRHNNRGGGRHFGGRHSRSRDNDSRGNRPNKVQKVGA